MGSYWSKIRRIIANLARVQALATHADKLDILSGQTAEIEDLLNKKADIEAMLQARSISEKAITSLREDLDMSEYCQNSVMHPCPPRDLKRKIKVGCSYNMANNFYNLVHCMQRMGIDAELVLWRGYDYSVLADPRWETERLLVTEFQNADLSLLKTSQPKHVREISSKAVESKRPVSLPHPRHLLNVWGYLENNVDEFITAMRDYDLLLVSGQAVILAPFVGKPYITFPHGGDLYETPFGNEKINRLCRVGWQRASAHILSGGHFYRYAEMLGLHNYTYIPILVDTERYAPRKDNAIRLELHQRFNCNFIFTAPARHDWEWKGTDKIINAAAQVKSKTDTRFVVMFSNWGNDYEKSRELIKDHRLENVCVFTGAMSKPVLHDYMHAADVVMDQFTIGEYGTLTLEAMAMERPVMLYYKSAIMPPIINAFTTDEIAEKMLYAINHHDEMQVMGVQARRWVMENHGPGAIVPKFQHVAEAVLNGQEIPQYPRIM